MNRNMGGSTIRRAVPSDAYDIAGVHVRTWQSAYRGLIPDSYLESLSISKRAESWAKQLEKSADGTRYFVAELEGEIVGFGTVGKNGDDDSPDDVGELYAIYVLPGKQGIGIGSALLEAGLAFLKHEQFKRVTLWVLEGNHSSRRWYESRGWQLEGGLKTDERDGFQLHEIRYVLDLDGQHHSEEVPGQNSGTHMKSGESV